VSAAVQVSTTLDSEPRARELATRLVEERLAACVQVIGPLTSVYRWEGAVTESGEWLLLIKTGEGALHRLIERIRTLHPYQVPEIIATPVVAGDEDYLAWVERESSAQP
jgi:periplasmic divalent cation tolerance protein